MLVKELMTREVETVGPRDPLETAAGRMLEARIGCLPVLDDQDKLVGILTRSDFIAHDESVPLAFFKAPKLFGSWLDEPQLEEAYQRARRLRVEDVMSHPVRTVGPDDMVAEASKLMRRHDIAHVPVVRNNRLVGIVTVHDLLGLVTGDDPAARD